MAANAGYKTRVLLGSLNLSGQIRDTSTSYDVDMLDVSTLADQAKSFIVGQTTGTFSASGPLDVSTSTNSPYNILTAWTASTPLPLTFAPNGLTTGADVLLHSALQASYNTTGGVQGTVDFDLTAQVTDRTETGTVIEDLTAITIDGNGTARNCGGASANGGIAHLHVTAFSGLTNNIVTIEHSVDGVTSWATLVTFATYTGITGERVEVAAGTTIRQYLRVVDNVTGTGSTTRAVAFARRP